jgi:ketosteroid isomerase-like protein
VRNTTLKPIPLLLFAFVSTLLLPHELFGQSFAKPQSTETKRSARQTDEDTASEIKRMENELARAVVARDYTALLKLEVATYVYTDSDAVVTTRDEFIRQYKEGTSQVTSLRFDDMKVDIYGDAAVVRGVLTVERETNGVKIARVSRYTRFYIRLPVGWRAVAGHSSVLKSDQK